MFRINGSMRFELFSCVVGCVILSGRSSACAVVFSTACVTEKSSSMVAGARRRLDMRNNFFRLAPARFRAPSLFHSLRRYVYLYLVCEIVEEHEILSTSLITGNGALVRISLAECAPSHFTIASFALAFPFRSFIPPRPVLLWRGCLVRLYRPRRRRGAPPS